MKKPYINILILPILLFACSDNSQAGKNSIDGYWKVKIRDKTNNLTLDAALKADIRDKSETDLSNKIYCISGNKIKTYKISATSSTQYIHCSEKDANYEIQENKLIIKTSDGNKNEWSYRIEGQDIILETDINNESSSNSVKYDYSLSVTLEKQNSFACEPVIEEFELYEEAPADKAINGGYNCIAGNGCGMGSTVAIVELVLIYDFHNYCNNHDACYTSGNKTYGKSCKDCDDYLYNEMCDYCEEEFGEWYDVREYSCKAEAALAYYTIRAAAETLDYEANHGNDPLDPYNKADEPQATCCNFLGWTTPPPCFWETANFDTPCDIPGLGLDCCN